MNIREKKSIVALPLIIFFAWLYWGIIDFSDSIPTQEELREPEIYHPKSIEDYIFEAPFYLLIGLALYLLWRIISRNLRK